MVRNTSTARPVLTPLTGRQLPASHAPMGHRPEGRNLDVVQRYLNYVVAKDTGGPASETRYHEPRTGRADSVREQRPPVPSVVRDVMTREVISVVHRLPVVDGSGRLLGIVSRGDLLRTFLRADKEIRQEVLDQIVPIRMGLDPATLAVGVQDGVVTVVGTIESQVVMESLLHQIGQVGGVIGIRNDLTV